MTNKVTQIQFVAPLKVGARVVARAFGSLPQDGEEQAWMSRENALKYCETWDISRADIGGYYVPRVAQSDGDVEIITIITPSSGREVSYFPQGNLWTVEFPGGSELASSNVLLAMTEDDEPQLIEGVRITHQM